MDARTNFGIQQVVVGGRHTLVLTGELDVASAPMLGGALAHIPMDADTGLVLDLRGVSFIDSIGMRAVLVAQELCARCGAEFALVPGQAQVQRVFEMCGLLDRLPFRDDEGYGPHPSSADAKTDPEWLVARAPRASDESKSGD
jgi:anti-sigma B factor antagonist